MAMRDKKRREEIKNVDKREKVRLFTKKRERKARKMEKRIKDVGAREKY